MTECVLTLVAAERAGSQIAGAADEAKRALTEIGARVDGIDWLAPDLACDIAFADLAPDQADAAVRAAFARLPGPVTIDVMAQQAAGRRRMLLVADMEATMIANEMLDELAAMKGIGAQIAAITARAMNGEVDFAEALRERVALLADMPETVLAEAATRIRITPGARELVATMRAHGGYTALVSGGFRVFADKVRHMLGFDVAVANELIVENGRIVGTVREPILGREAKLATLTLLSVQRGLSFDSAVAVGDGANDLAMIEAAGMGVAYRAKPIVAAQARLRVDHADLTALLYAQGYREDEFVATS